MQYVPPQHPVLPVEEGSTGQLPELTPLGLLKGWLPNAPETSMVSSVASLSDEAEAGSQGLLLHEWLGERARFWKAQLYTFFGVTTHSTRQ